MAARAGAYQMNATTTGGFFNMVQGGGELGLGLPTGLFYLFWMGLAGAFGCFGFCMFQMCSCCRDNREHDRDKHQREEDEEMGRVVPRSERWGGKPLPCQWLRDLCEDMSAKEEDHVSADGMQQTMKKLNHIQGSIQHWAEITRVVNNWELDGPTDEGRSRDIYEFYTNNINRKEDFYTKIDNLVSELNKRDHSLPPHL
jgi:hypothetical protein